MFMSVFIYIKRFLIRDEHDGVFGIVLEFCVGNRFDSFSSSYFFIVSFTCSQSEIVDFKAYLEHFFAFK